ncbi:hypothetical protein LCGC14_2167390, partial [marine sediment metagenome]
MGSKPAIDGGKPVRQDFLIFGSPLILEPEIEEVSKTLRSGWLGTGPKTHEFERRFGEYIGSKWALALGSCTAGLFLALDVLGTADDSEVITSPITFPATANVIVHHGAKPVFVDVEKAFFSPRLSTERERIADVIRDGETVINMFGGVGMFSILAAKNKKCTVYNIDINPVASQLCEKNISLNKLAGEVISLNGDAAQIVNDQLKEKGDRTLMLLPERSDEFLESAILATKNGGII